MRQQTIRNISAWIDGAQMHRPLRVAVDGRTASGKTTLADEIATHLRALGRQVIRTSIDGFHRPKVERYARGRNSAEGYYHDARDLPAIRRLLLDPLGDGGDLSYRTASFDLDADLPIETSPERAGVRDILIVDGTFLQRPELRDGWDVVVFVDVDAATALTRGVLRDRESLGGHDAAQKLYTERYAAAYDIYHRINDPMRHAHIMVDNRDLEGASARLVRPLP